MVLESLQTELKEPSAESMQVTASHDIALLSLPLPRSWSVIAQPSMAASASASMYHPAVRKAWDESPKLGRSIAVILAGHVRTLLCLDQQDLIRKMIVKPFLVRHAVKSNDLFVRQEGAGR